MVWLVLIAVALQCLPLLPWGQRSQYVMIMIVAAWLVQLVAYVLLIIGVVLLLTAQGSHPVIIVACGILMVAPCANFLLLVLVNMSVTRTLRRAGLHVGLMGVKQEEVERIVNPELCSGCGYNLTGNVSGYCPECGRAIEWAVSGWPG